MEALLCRFPYLTQKQLFVDYLVMKGTILTIMQYLLAYHSPNDLIWKFGCYYYFSFLLNPLRVLEFSQMFCIYDRRYHI